MSSLVKHGAICFLYITKKCKNLLLKPSVSYIPLDICLPPWTTHTHTHDTHPPRAQKQTLQQQFMSIARTEELFGVLRREHPALFSELDRAVDELSRRFKPELEVWKGQWHWCCFLFSGVYVFLQESRPFLPCS
jgi:hypothetical protein